MRSVLTQQPPHGCFAPAGQPAAVCLGPAPGASAAFAGERLAVDDEGLDAWHRRQGAMQLIAEAAALLHDDELPSLFAEVVDEVVKLIQTAFAQIMCLTEAEGGEDVAAGLVAVDAHMHERGLVTSHQGFAQGGLELLGENGRGAGHGSTGAVGALGLRGWRWRRPCPGLDRGLGAGGFRSLRQWA